MLVTKEFTQRLVKDANEEFMLGLQSHIREPNENAFHRFTVIPVDWKEVRKNGCQHVAIYEYGKDKILMPATEYCDYINIDITNPYEDTLSKAYRLGFGLASMYNALVMSARARKATYVSDLLAGDNLKVHTVFSESGEPYGWVAYRFYFVSS